MASRLNAYLNFDGNAREAMEFYRSVFGGTLTMTTFADLGAQGTPDQDRIMHAMLETDADYTIMAADVTSEMDYRGISGCSLSLSGDDADRLGGYWDKLSAGGAITVPLQKQAWGDEFGMCVDQFGVPWMVNMSQPAA